MAAKDKKALEELLIQVGLRIAKRGEGALFIVGDVEYQTMMDQSVPSFKIDSNPKLLESLALIDGAVVINKEGYVVAYGAKIRSDKVFKNHGTRHAAGISASKKGNLVVLVSEEDKKVKILKNEKMIMQIDALEKNVEKSVSGAVKVLESVGAGTIGTIGTGILAPTVGLAFLPGIIIFGSVYYLGKVLHEKYHTKK